MCQTFLKTNNSISFKIKINFIKSIYTFLVIANTNETRHFDEVASSNVKKQHYLFLFSLLSYGEQNLLRQFAARIV